MVKKLLKHEFIYYLRTFGIFLPIVLVVGAMAQVFRLLDNGEVFSELAIFSSTGMLAVSCMAVLVMSTVVCVVRFYKNMFSAEGYLTFTLPVTNAQHIFVKLLMALVCQAATLLTVIIAVAIALIGEPMEQMIRGFTILFRDAFSEFGMANTAIYIVEFIVMLVLAAAGNMLLLYCCIAVGQTAKKNRILMAVAAYFVYYIATQVLGTIVAILWMALGISGVLNQILMLAQTNLALTMHLYMLLVLVVNGGAAVLFWLVTQHIMTKKLNLE